MPIEPTEANPDNGSPSNQNPQGGNPPGNNGNDGGQNPSEPVVQISQKELEALKTNAGRWDKHQQQRREQRRSSRGNRTQDEGKDELDGLDDDALDIVKRSQLQAQSAQQEVFNYKLKDQVKNILNSDDYKDLSPAAKRLIEKNPMAYVNPKSKTVDDAVADIQDFLDDEMDSLRDQGAGNRQDPEKKPPENPTPPANGSKPTVTKVADEESVEGKTGSARSTTVLKNLFKRNGIGGK